MVTAFRISKANTAHTKYSVWSQGQLEQRSKRPTANCLCSITLIRTRRIQKAQQTGWHLSTTRMRNSTRSTSAVQQQAVLALLAIATSASNRPRATRKGVVTATASSATQRKAHTQFFHKSICIHSVLWLIASPSRYSGSSCSGPV